MTAGGTGVLAGLLCSLALATPASASLAFGPPVNLSPADQNATRPQVAFDGSGNALAVWQRSYGANTIVEGAFRPAGSSFETPVVLSDPDQIADTPQVAFDGSGNALVVWRRYITSSSQIVQAVFRPAGGGFTLLPDLSAAGHYAYDPQIAFDGSGNALAVWWGDDGSTYRVEGSFRPAGGASTSFFEAPVHLSLAGADAAKPQVAFDGSGNALAVWEHAVAVPGSSPVVYNSVVQSSFRPVGGTTASSFQTPADRSAGGRDAHVPQVAFDGSGNALAVWTRNNNGGAQDSVQGSFRPAGGAFAAPVDLSPTGSTQVAQPQVAFDGSGNALAVWRRANGTNVVVQSAFRPAGGAFAPAVDLTAAGQDGETPQIAFDGSGNALAVWRNFNGLVQGAFRPPGGAFQAPVNLSEAGQTAVEPQVALSASGNALVAWDRPNTAGNSIVQAAFGGPPASGVPPPQVLPVVIPSGGGGGGGARDTTAPRVQGASMSPTTWGVSPQGKAEVPVSARVPKGTRFTYALSEPARVLFRIERASPGRKVRSKCVRRTRSNGNRRACTRYTRFGAFAQDGVAGKNVKRFSGRIGKKTLSPGKYRATLVATDRAGNRSVARRLTFTVVRG